jgi:hypothetical protein
MQSSLYYAFLQAKGAFEIGPDKNELCLHKASQFGDLVQIVVVVTKYTSSFNISAKIPHLEGEKMFGSVKCKTNLPPKLKANSHRHDRVNFFYPKVANTMALIN